MRLAQFNLVRMWEFYLAASEMSFPARTLVRRCGLPANSSAAGPCDDVSWSKKKPVLPTVR